MSSARVLHSNLAHTRCPHSLAASSQTSDQPLPVALFFSAASQSAKATANKKACRSRLRPFCVCSRIAGANWNAVSETPSASFLSSFRLLAFFFLFFLPPRERSIVNLFCRKDGKPLSPVTSSYCLQCRNKVSRGKRISDNKSSNFPRESRA